MTNTLKLTITAACLVMALVQAGLGQQGSVPTSLAAAEERVTREQDGLQGPVRRVRVETARVVVKGDKMVEGPRVLRGVATYDPLGKKIDAVDYPLESNTVPGKEKYRYDDKGNIIEMVVVGSDGSILGKEAYDYELDPMGNWTKMNTAVAVYENGKVTFEPTEVTYRTISYYYNQAIEKISRTTSKTKIASQPSTSAPVSAPLSTVKAVAKPVVTDQPVAEKVAAIETASATKSAAVPTTPTHSNDSVGTETSPIKAANTAPGNTAKPSVIKFEENVLRSAAIDLPQPEYPQTALITRAAGPVEVQLLVNEKGIVTNARAQSGNPLLIPAAEAAALKARFSPSKLAADPTIAFGVITYNFFPPDAASPAPASTIGSNPRPADERKVASNPAAERNALATTRPATFTEPQPKPNLESESSQYSRGVTFLIAGNYEEAATALNQAVQANPNDANAYLKLALSYSALHKDKEAVAGYKMAKQIERSVFDASAYFNWGRSYLALDKTSDAISAFKQTLTLMRAEAIGLEPKTSASVPSLEQVHHHLGVAYINDRRFSDAIKEFKQVVALNPANAEAHYALAVSYLNTGDQRAAQDESKILASLDPEMAKKLATAIADPSAQMGCRNIGCRR
jgi:Flp pilus assembly protein TadD